MKFIICGFLSLFLWSASAASAAECNGKDESNCIETPGCYYTLGSCAECKQNYYCLAESTTLQPCQSSHPNSYSGADSETDCYKNCDNFSINNGTLQNKDIKAYYPNACTYKVQDFDCETGFAKNPTMEDTDPVTDDNKDNICIQKIECYKLYGNCKDGEVWGWAEFTQNAWSYSDCRCRLENQTIGNGTGICGYHYKSGTGDKTEWETICTPEEVTACDAGYCQTNENNKACAQAPKGYYSPAKSTTCEKCPIGSTTDGGAES